MRTQLLIASLMLSATAMIALAVQEEATTAVQKGAAAVKEAATAVQEDATAAQEGTAGEEDAAAQGESEMGASEQDAQAAMMARWTEAMTPNEHHAGLAKMVGEWKTVTKCWHDPNMEPAVTEGHSTFTAVLGGRFVMQNFQGAMKMGEQEMPFEGLGMTGYDNVKKKYVATWADSAGTSILVMEGDMSADGKTLTMQGQFECPMTGQPSVARSVCRMIDDDTHVFELYGTVGDAPEAKMLEITYTRQGDIPEVDAPQVDIPQAE